MQKMDNIITESCVLKAWERSRLTLRLSGKQSTLRKSNGKKHARLDQFSEKLRIFRACFFSVNSTASAFATTLIREDCACSLSEADCLHFSETGPILHFCLYGTQLVRLPQVHILC